MENVSKLINFEDIRQIAVREVSTKGYFNPVIFFRQIENVLDLNLKDITQTDLCSLVRTRLICGFCINKSCTYSHSAKQLLKQWLKSTPPCIRNAYRKNVLTIVASYYIKTKIHNKDFSILDCEYLRKIKICSVKDKCANLKQSKKILLYNYR